MDNSLTPPLYTSIITLPSGPDSPDAEAYAQALSTLPTYRRIDHVSSDHPVIHLGSGLWFFLFGTLASTSRPIPVTVEISDSTATIRPRSLARTMIPQPQLANRPYRTAIDVRDALATVAPTHPQMVTRMTPMRGEILRSWWLGLIVGLAITAALIILYSIILNPLDPAILSVPIFVMVVTYGIRYPFTRASSPSWTPQGEPEVLRLT